MYKKVREENCYTNIHAIWNWSVAIIFRLTQVNSFPNFEPQNEIPNFLFAFGIAAFEEIKFCRIKLSRLKSYSKFNAFSTKVGATNIMS